MALILGKTLTEAEHRQVALLVRIHRLTAAKRIAEHFQISDQWVRKIEERYEWEVLEEPLSAIVAFLQRRSERYHGPTDVERSEKSAEV